MKIKRREIINAEQGFPVRTIEGVTPVILTGELSHLSYGVLENGVIVLRGHWVLETGGGFFTVTPKEFILKYEVVND